MNRKSLSGYVLIIPLFILSLMWPTQAFAQKTEQKTRFAVIGDYGSDAEGTKGAKAENQVANMVKSWNPSFIITVGDNNYKCGATTTIVKNIGKYYCDFIYNPGAPSGQACTGKATNDKTNRFFPALGNHDWYTQTAGLPQPYLDYFTQLPGNKRYYDFVQGPIHFFAVDSESKESCASSSDDEAESQKCPENCGQEPDGGKSSSVQGQWLNGALKGSTSPWKLVFFHRPPYSCSGAASWMQWPFEQWGASAILAGHHHVYERIFQNTSPGFPYFVNGVGGTTLTTCKKSKIQSNLTSKGFTANIIHGHYGAMLVEASEKEIDFKFYVVGGKSGQLRDHCKLRKTTGGQTFSCVQVKRLRKLRPPTS